MRKLIISTIVVLAVGVLFTGCGTEPAYLNQGENIGSYLDNSSAGDQKVTSDISEIRSALLAYAQAENTFPPQLSDLLPRYLEEIPVSPITNEPYEYRGDLLGGDFELHYELSTGQEFTANVNTSDLQMKPEIDKPIYE